MTSTKQNFSVFAGDTFTVSIGVTDSDVAASLSGACAVWIIEEYVGSGSLLRKTIDDDISISGSTVSISVCPSETLNLAGDYYHELEITDTSGNISTVTTGTITINKSGASL